MQSYSNDHRGYKEENYSVVEEDYIFRNEHSYNTGSTVHMMKPADHYLPKQNNSQSHGYAHGGYNNPDNKGHVAQYSSEARYEEDRGHDGWGVKNDHYGHGGNTHYSGSNYPHKEGMNHGAYGAHQGQYGHHKEGMNHGGYGVHQGQYGHHQEGMKMNHGGYEAHQGQYGLHGEGMNMSHGGYGGHQGHNGHHYPEVRKKVSMWEFKSIVD